MFIACLRLVSYCHTSVSPSGRTAMVQSSQFLPAEGPHNSIFWLLMKGSGTCVLLPAHHSCVYFKHLFLVISVEQTLEFIVQATYLAGRYFFFRGRACTLRSLGVGFALLDHRGWGGRHVV